MKITLEGGALDIPTQTKCTFDWVAFRFSKTLREAYSTDFEIPRTTNNVRLLEASGLLDSYTQPFGKKLAPCTFVEGNYIMNAYIQVVSVSKKSIKVCLYEDSFFRKYKDKKINDYYEDDDSTIFVWSCNTRTAYPNDFKSYFYGMQYDNKFAQLHACMKVNPVMQGIDAVFPQLSDDWYFISTKKVVCPQNKRQMIEGRMEPDTGDIVLSCGNHITNNGEIEWGESSQKDIYFNRECDVTIKYTLAWKSKNNNSMFGRFLINHNYQGTNDTYDYQVRGDLYTNKVETGTKTYHMHEGSKLNFGFVNRSDYDYVGMIADLYIENYTITEDDYNEELQYCYRHPKLLCYDYNSNNYIEAYWDATTYRYSYRERGTSHTYNANVITQWRGMSYFGKWVNMPDIKITDVFVTAQWIRGEKLKVEDGRLSFVSPNNAKIIKGIIQEIRPTSDKLGQNNYVFYNKSPESVNPVSIIDNEWLDEKKEIFKSTFSYAKPLSLQLCSIDQYTNPVEEDSGEPKVDFEDVGPVICWTWRSGGIFTPDNLAALPLNALSIDKLTQCLEVDITTTNDLLSDFDFVYLDGRKYFVVSGTTSTDRLTTLKCLLIPNTVNNN